MDIGSSQAGYFDLKGLAIYASCSVRWLRDRLTDRAHPLPHHRVEGKILIRREDFDRWISTYRVEPVRQNLDCMVDNLMRDLLSAGKGT